MHAPAILSALMAAALFGASTPLAKLMIGRLHPLVLAGLFYAGSGIGLAVLHLVRSRGAEKPEAPLARRDIPWLAGSIFSGGVVGPVLLMLGLSRTDGTAASLLLTLEGVATALVAWWAFKENYDRRIASGMLFIFAGAALLVWPDSLNIDSIAGPLLIVAACVAWAIDNNLTRKVSLSDPVQIVMIKGLAAGPVALAMAALTGAPMPPSLIALLAGVTGFFGYGISLVLFVIALRHLGAARTGAYFSTAPFIGAALSVPLLGEPLTLSLLAAGALMAAGVWLHLTERHAHEHVHEPLTHDHAHVHDAHHQHSHGPGDPPGKRHSHRHVHVRLRHVHAHAPDSHHRHRH